MKPYLTRLIALLALVCYLGISSSKAQLCQVDTSYTSPGTYPSDTLPLMLAQVNYTQVVQFVFPSDTTVFGFTLNFDSFVVASVTGIPAGINWECNANHPVCHYICHPPALTRGCVKIFGMPLAQSPAYPGYDSIMVTGEAWVTVPFVGATSFSQDIPVYYRVLDLSSASRDPYANFDLKMVPNPVSDLGKVSFQLAAASEVELRVIDIFGREQVIMPNQWLAGGERDETVRLTGLAPGVYFLRASVNGGEYETTQKFLKMN